MDKRFLRSVIFGCAALVLMAACAPKATPPPVDIAGTVAVRLAADMLSQTAAAYTSTPPPATITPSPAVTETPTVPLVAESTKHPVVIGFVPCWTGPGPTYTLISNISDGKKVELLGIGSVQGWYVIRNPYFNVACWVSAENLKIFTDTDLTKFPVMTPQAR